MRVQRLCEDVELFVQLHAKISPLQRNWVAIDQNSEIDWPQTYRQCIDGLSPESAFKFAAANALEEVSLFFFYLNHYCSFFFLFVTFVYVSFIITVKFFTLFCCSEEL